MALKSDATAEKAKNQLWRDFPRRSIFDFCNNIGTFRKWWCGCMMSVDWGNRKWSEVALAEPCALVVTREPAKQ